MPFLVRARGKHSYFLKTLFEEKDPFGGRRVGVAGTRCKVYMTKKKFSWISLASSGGSGGRENQAAGRYVIGG
jgi:hypothetical protein